MKDYSISEEERKDFVLDFDETEEGLYANFAGEREAWPLPNNEENRQKLLDKMHDQVKNSSKFEHDKNIEKIAYKASIVIHISIIFLTLITLKNFNILNISLMSFFSIMALGSFIGYTGVSSKLKDLEKNKAFIEMEKELNSNIRSNNNTLANVSSKTKKMATEIPEDRPIFDINSFNNVPFKDLKQIKANIDRNKKFGFVYDENASYEEDYSEEKKQSTGMSRIRKI